MSLDRVLIVDDEQPVREMIARMVTTEGERECQTAGDAAEARVLLARQGFSIVICDVSMPGESGAELTRWIREHHPDVAVLMATGIDDPALAESVLEIGAYGYLVKPFKRHEVQINVTNALGRRRLGAREPRSSGAARAPGRGAHAGAASLARGDDPAFVAGHRVPQPGDR